MKEIDKLPPSWREHIYDLRRENARLRVRAKASRIELAALRRSIA
ncbi:hypothetical protein [Mycobacteroides abscessus]|nr:hypothetical protein [Mycobacteroides abscessus]